MRLLLNHICDLYFCCQFLAVAYFRQYGWNYSGFLEIKFFHYAKKVVSHLKEYVTEEHQKTEKNCFVFALFLKNDNRKNSKYVRK